MDRYTIEMGAVLVAGVWLHAFLIAPALATLHPAFATPMLTVTDPDATYLRWRFTVNWGSPRLYTMLAVVAAMVFSWAKWREDELRENILEKHAIDIENYR